MSTDPSGLCLDAGNFINIGSPIGLKERPSESQLAALVLRFIEVLRPQPSLVAGLEARPIAVGHCKPGGIAILTFDDHMLAKDALETKAETFRSASGWIVSTIALPLESAVAEREGIVCKEEQGLGCHAAASNRWSPQDMTDFNHAIGQVDAQKCLAPLCTTGRFVDHGKKKWIRSSYHRL